MAEKMEGMCFVCRKAHEVFPVSEKEAVAIAEDAQSLADYYVMSAHNDLNGRPCEGSGKTPHDLLEEDNGNFVERGDYDDEGEYYDDQPLAPLSDEVRRLDKNQDELLLYGPKAHE